MPTATESGPGPASPSPEREAQAAAPLIAQLTPENWNPKDQDHEIPEPPPVRDDDAPTLRFKPSATPEPHIEGHQAGDPPRSPSPANDLILYQRGVPIDHAAALAPVGSKTYDVFHSDTTAEQMEQGIHAVAQTESAKERRDWVRNRFSTNPALAQEFLELALGKVFKFGFYYNTDKVPSKKGGYVQLSAFGVNKFCVLGEMLGWAKGINNIGGTLEISHLCHNPLCTIPSHVVAETRRDNNARKGCKVWVDCPHDDCQLKVKVCDHQPMCIRFAEGYETWEEFKAWGLH